MIIGIFGFPQSGKSTYICEILYYELLKNNNDFFIQKANPDRDRPLTSKGKLIVTIGIWILSLSLQGYLPSQLFGMCFGFYLMFSGFFRRR